MKKESDSLRALLSKWDRGNKSVRLRILERFVGVNSGGSRSELDEKLCLGSSLFFARLLSFLRLSYVRGREVDLALQLRAVTSFLGSVSGSRFVQELVLSGGALTLRDILNEEAPAIGEKEKAAAVQALGLVAGSGRAFKEYLCEKEVVPAILQCSAGSAEEQTQALVQELVVTLGTGNPRYVSVLQDRLFTVFRSPVTHMCRVHTAQALCRLLGDAVPSSPSRSHNRQQSFQVDARYVDLTVMLFFANDLRVHHEAYRLLTVLVRNYHLGETVVLALNDILADPTGSHGALLSQAASAGVRGVGSAAGDGGGGGGDGEDGGSGGGTGGERTRGTASLAARQLLPSSPASSHVACPPRACAARMLDLLLDIGPQYAHRLAAKGTVLLLLACLADSSHMSVPRYAASTLARLVQQSEVAARMAQGTLGEALYQTFLQRSSSLHREPDLMEAIRAALCATGDVVPADATADGDGSGGAEGEDDVADIAEPSITVNAAAGRSQGRLHRPSVGAETVLSGRSAATLHGHHLLGPPRPGTALSATSTTMEPASSRHVVRQYMDGLGLTESVRANGPQLYKPLALLPDGAALRLSRQPPAPEDVLKPQAAGSVGAAEPQGEGIDSVQEAYLDMHLSDHLDPHRGREPQADARGGMMYPHVPTLVENHGGEGAVGMGGVGRPRMAAAAAAASKVHGHRASAAVEPSSSSLAAALTETADSVAPGRRGRTRATAADAQRARGHGQEQHHRLVQQAARERRQAAKALVEASTRAREEALAREKARHANQLTRPDILSVALMLGNKRIDPESWSSVQHAAAVRRSVSVHGAQNQQ